MNLSPRFLFVLIVFANSLLGQAAGLEPAALRCEYRVNPQGIDEIQPRLTWQIGSDQRGAKQSAYQILVASSAERLAKSTGDLWDSGQVASDQTVNIAYAGKPLVSRQQCFWKVCVWDGDDKASWSEAASWTMGLLHPADWQADFISFRDTTPVWTNKEKLFLPPAHQYRKEFSANKKSGAPQFMPRRWAFMNFASTASVSAMHGSRPVGPIIINVPITKPTM